MILIELQILIPIYKIIKNETIQKHIKIILIISKKNLMNILL